MKTALFIFSAIILCAAVLFPSMLGQACKDHPWPGDEIRPPVKKIFPQGYFVEPTDSSLNIAGNFGEIRPNHFHAGLDVKTAGREGLNVYAVAGGYVSRVKISAFGYGKALYITHPNGFVSVYAHLQRLSGKIAKYVEEQHYKLENFEIDIQIPKDVLKVKQCDTVAISGNTGGSRSPHLHFEIRDEKTEVAYNPFLFGYEIKDQKPPELLTLAIYPAGERSLVNGKNSSRKTRIYGSNGNYHLSSAEKISVSGDIGFGIESFDYANVREAGKLGPYSIDLYIDKKRIYYHELNEISFEESRYINSHIDYAEDARSNREIQKCFLDKNNMLSIYQCVVNDGVFHFDDTLTHKVSFIVKDFFGNASSLEFNAYSSPIKNKSNNDLVKKPENWMNCHDQNIFEKENVKVRIDPCGLYEDIDFQYDVSKDTLPGKLAPVHKIHETNVPVHAPFALSINIKNIPIKYQDKTTIVLLDGNNTMTSIGGSTYVSLPNKKGEGAGKLWVTANTKYFGRYSVALDTVAPSIKPYNIFNNKNMSRQKIIGVTIGDNLSGIKSYRATVDGKWILMEYEPKKALLFYEFDEHVAEGKHTFEIVVTDKKNNSRSYKADFVR